MSSNWSPWTSAEEAEWEREVRQDPDGSIEELIDHMASDGLAGSSYDPLQPQEEWSEEEVVAS
jgi:hypothetical protein